MFLKVFEEGFMAFFFWYAVMGDLDFSIKIHHGGKFIDSGQWLEYLGGMIVEDLHFEVDEWSLQEIVSQLKQLGYKGFARVWYKENI